MKRFNGEVLEHGIDKLKDFGEGLEASEVHFHLYNEDYFIIYHFEAEKFLKERTEEGIFGAIERVREYEQENFGESMTEVNPESIANMYAYIEGEEILSECKTLRDNWDKVLTESHVKAIIEELEELSTY